MNSNKIAVKINKQRVTEHVYQRLCYCTSCGKYTSLGDQKCNFCGSEGRLITMDRHFDIILKRRFQIERLVALMLSFIGLFFCSSIYQIIIMLLAGAAMNVLLFLLQEINRRSEHNILIADFFKMHHKKISADLLKDMEVIGGRIGSEQYKEAYEGLRDIGMLVKNDDVKLRKLFCLNKFILRKDAELELDTVIVNDYNPVLIEYIYDVLRLNRNLVKRSVIDYVIKYESEILGEEHGIQLLGSVADAAVRARHNILLYKDFIMRYVRFMKKDRLIRLYTLLKGEGLCNLNDLYGEVIRIFNTEYKDDPDIRAILSI